MDDKLKVFISWSGSPSKEIAIALQRFLKFCGTHWDTFVSDRDIESGSRGLPDIATQLSLSKVGICIVTKDNQNNPWLNFEAGALSKTTEDPNTKVIPLLVEMTNTDFSNSVLNQFQARKFKREDLRRVILDLATWASEDPDTVADRFDARYAQFETQYEEALAAATATTSEPDPRTSAQRSDAAIDENTSDDLLSRFESMASVLDELLGLVRQQAREAAQSPQTRLRHRAGVRPKVPLVEAVEHAVHETLDIEGLNRAAVQEISTNPEEVSIALGEPVTDTLAGHVVEGIYKRLGAALTVQLHYRDMSGEAQIREIEGLL